MSERDRRSVAEVLRGSAASPSPQVPVSSVSSRRAPELPDPLDVIRRIVLGRRGLLHTQEYARALADAEQIYDAMEKP